MILKNKKIIIFFFILMIISFSVGFGYSYVKNIFNKVEKVNLNEAGLDANSELSNKYKDVENIAVFGVDSDGDVGRSDSIMIVTIDRRTNEGKITSLMRDCYVRIDGHGMDKLNHAYAFGGPELAIKTINKNFNLNIENFVTVNFSTLPKLIDLVGGLDIDVDSEEIKYINSYINELNGINHGFAPAVKKTGMQYLDGIQTMAYCRIRYTEGGDYKRAERQREVLEKLLEKILKLSPTKYPEILEKALPMLKTSFDSDKLMSLSMEALKIGNNLKQDRFPKDEQCKEVMINNIDYLEFDKNKTIEDLHRWIFGE
ncbi:MAG: LCP family protein [Sarcina sp.]